MNIVITGATSFIGVYLTQHLLEKGHYVYVCIRPNSLKRNIFLTDFAQYDRLTVVEIAMENISEIIKYIPVKCDVFYHLAWEGTRRPHRDNEQIQEQNYIYTMKALNISKKIGCSKFIGFGSQAEYGNTDSEISENHSTQPNSAYGLYKLKSFNEGLKYSSSNEINFIWARIFSLYGKGDSENSLIMQLIKKMLKNEPIDLTECTQVWNFLHVRDAVDAIIGLQETNCPSGCYNVASNDTRILKEYVLELQKNLGSTGMLNFGAIPYGREGIVNLKVNTDKIKHTLKWEPKVSFSEGIGELLKGFNECQNDERL